MDGHDACTRANVHIPTSERQGGEVAWEFRHERLCFPFWFCPLPLLKTPSHIRTVIGDVSGWVELGGQGSMNQSLLVFRERAIIIASFSLWGHRLLVLTFGGGKYCVSDLSKTKPLHIVLWDPQTIRRHSENK